MDQGKAPAGWYSDSERAGGMRYWDGNAWTEHRSGPAAASSAVAPRTVTMSRRNLALLISASVLSLAVACCALVSTADTSKDTVKPSATKPVSAPASAAAEATSSQPTPAHVPAEPSFSDTLLKAEVVRVVDGDTAVFRLEGGVEEKVRFIGIDTPESTNSIEVYGKEASAYTSKALPIGASVLLQKDVEERDKYGRLLAYVWLSPPVAETEAEIRSKMLNAKLALDGYAQQMTIQPNSRNAEYFTTFVAEARDANRGLWNPALVEEAPAAPAPAPAAPAPVAKPPSTPSASYIGNKNTKKFHYADCYSVSQMNPSNKVPLKTRAQAVSLGYVPCKNCNP
jgi:micrococcal nuclease